MSTRKKNPAIARPFTALLLYPGYLAPDWPYETYLAHVEAGDAGEAIQEAKEEAYYANKGAAETPDCFYCLAVFEGHHHDLP